MNARMSITALVIIGCFVCGSLAYLFADNAVNHADTADLTEESIGGYYDEIWNATRIFRTAETSAGSGKVCYAVKDLSKTPPDEFETSKDPTVYLKDDTTGNYASLPQHTVVTEWEVSGHVHFPN